MPGDFPRNVLLGPQRRHSSQFIIRKVTDGWLLGENFGEFGGTLEFADHGTHIQTLLEHVNPIAFIEWAGRLWLLSGLGHLLGRSGQISLIEAAPRRATTVLELYGMPTAYRITEHALSIATTSGVIELDKNLNVLSFTCHAE